MDFDVKIIFYIVWISVVLVIAYFGLRKEWSKEKAKEKQKLERERNKNKAFDKISKSYAMQYIDLPDEDAFPSLDDGYEFADLAWYAIDDPPDPPLPKLGRKRKITQGDLVRLGVIFEPEGEPVEVWVEVSAATGEELFAGVVFEASDPSVEKLSGAQVRFHANHIAEITLGDRGRLN